MKKLLPTGNCPYCDAERGIHTSWGMSPEGWGNMKDDHDAGHPKSEECKCACGEQEIIGGAEVEIGGVCHRQNNPCYIIPTPTEKEGETLKKLVDDICSDQTGADKPYQEHLEKWARVIQTLLHSKEKELRKKIEGMKKLDSFGRQKEDWHGYYNQALEDVKALLDKEIK